MSSGQAANISGQKRTQSYIYIDDSSDESSDESASTSSSSAKQSKTAHNTVIGGIVDPESKINGTITKLDNTPCDCMLVQVDPINAIDKFYVLQLICSTNDDEDDDDDDDDDDDHNFKVYQRWGSTGTSGHSKTEAFDDYTDAVDCFEVSFKTLTGLSWKKRGDAPVGGKYHIIQQNFTEKKRGYIGAKWQYWVDDGVNGKRVSWYDYDKAAERRVEQLFHEYAANPQLTNRLVKSGFFTYNIDFVQMIQTNIKHHNRTSRRIRRCPTGSQLSTAPAPQHRTRSETITYTAPDDMVSIAMSRIIPASPPTGENIDDCVICLSEMKIGEDLVKFDMVGCNHIFHRECIKKAIQMSKPCCPTCRKPIDEVRGFGPSGTMEISTIQRVCSGYNSSIGTIVIDYDMPGDVQKQYHPNPGIRFHGVSRRAFLPDNGEGKELLMRLKYAFMTGLCFMVGTSMTTGAPNCITWSSIHHKSSMNSGAIYHGFPDINYFANCNLELDALGVPKAKDIVSLPLPLTQTQNLQAQTTSTNSNSTTQSLSSGVNAALAPMMARGAAPSQRQVQAGISVLNEIRNKINGGNVLDSYAELSSRFYTAIPHSFGRRRPPVISTATMLQERYDACNSLLQGVN